MLPVRGKGSNKSAWNMYSSQALVGARDRAPMSMCTNASQMLQGIEPMRSCKHKLSQKILKPRVSMHGLVHGIRLLQAWPAHRSMDIWLSMVLSLHVSAMHL